MAGERLVWLVPETRGGVQDYSRVLWASIQKCMANDARFQDWEGCEPIVLDLPSRATVDAAADRIRELDPSLVHIQHEFGLFGGSKLPMRYHFPAFVRAIRGPEAGTRLRLVATAHTVLDRQARYTYGGRGADSIFRLGLNLFVVPFTRRTWMQGTWGELDAVVVHSKLQAPAILDSGCPRVEVIPHYVLPPSRGGGATRTGAPEQPGERSPRAEVVVFGYLSPAKGQDLAIAALAHVDPSRRPHLVLAGGARRKEEAAFRSRCESMARRLGVSENVTITGFVPAEEVATWFDKATVVLAPFRETSGSGSIAQALGCGSAILASDLPLNRELAERVHGCIDLFEAGNPRACAERLGALLADADRRAALHAGAHRYTEIFGVEPIARQHLNLYARMLGDASV
jgi:glycosyltransferase involved in cell wall biosynthesis